MNKNEYEDEPSFSLHDFKKWMAGQNDKPARQRSELIGLRVESKLSPKRLVKRIEIEEGDSKSLVKEFCHYGGVIIGVDDNRLLVEVEEGSFYVPKFFCKKVK